MVNYTLNAEPIHINVSPTGFLFYATDFLNAHESYKSDNPFSPVSYYLVCRSLELSMKSFLLAKGMTRQEIKNTKKYGHDLKKILRKAKELGINTISPISDTQEEQIVQANNWYARKGFEYFELQNIVDGRETLPNLEVLIKIARCLVKDLKPLCLNVV